MIGPSRKGAEKIINKKKGEIAENKFLDIKKEPEPVKFYDFAKEYLQWAKTNKKASSYGREISRMRVLNKEFEAKPIQAITAWDIERYKAKRKEKVKPASVNRELALLKHMYSMAIQWGKLKDSPAKKVKLLKGEIKRVRFLIPEEINTVLSNCSDYLKPIVIVALHTGMRKGELLGLQWPQIDFEQGIITLIDTKNSERRDIPMNETVRETLMAIERNGSAVFCKGDIATFKRVGRAFDVAVRKSGIEDFRFHDLRHTFASNLIMQEGVELNDIRELLGHKQLTMTLRYAHLSPKHKRGVINILDRVMSLNPPQEKEHARKILEFKR